MAEREIVLHPVYYRLNLLIYIHLIQSMMVSPACILSQSSVVSQVGKLRSIDTIAIALASELTTATYRA